MRRSLPLFLALLLASCTGLSESAERDLGRAAATLEGQLSEPGLLATTALLYHADRGAYPTDAAALLGSAAARETGLQQLGLSALALTLQPDGLAMRYTLLPSATDPSDRFGTVTVAETDTVGTYNVNLLLERKTDPDRGRRALPLTEEGQYAVMRARGSLCANVAAIRTRNEDAVGDPPLDARSSYTVTFTPTEGTPAPPALQRGITVTLPR